MKNRRERKIYIKIQVSLIAAAVVVAVVKMLLARFLLDGFPHILYSKISIAIPS